MIASLGDYIYAKSDDAIYVNLFVGSNTTIPLKNGNVNVKMETNYPWDGNVTISIEPPKETTFFVRIRVPGWVHSEMSSPGKLYTGSPSTYHPYKIFINGKETSVTTENGYFVINRRWKKGDKVDVRFWLTDNIVSSRPELKQNVNRVAIQRGPLVYCIEGADNNGKAWNVIIPENIKFETIDYKVLDEPVKALTAEVPVVTVGEDGLSLKTEKKKIIAIPYYTWANRGRNEMQVWLPTKITDVKLNY